MAPSSLKVKRANFMSLSIAGTRPSRSNLVIAIIFMIAGPVVASNSEHDDKILALIVEDIKRSLVQLLLLCCFDVTHAKPNDVLSEESELGHRKEIVESHKHSWFIGNLGNKPRYQFTIVLYGESKQGSFSSRPYPFVEHSEHSSGSWFQTKEQWDLNNQPTM